MTGLHKYLVFRTKIFNIQTKPVNLSCINRFNKKGNVIDMLKFNEGKSLGVKTKAFGK